jgi:hypothetical protein
MTTGLKTCDTINPVKVNPSNTFAVDIWATDFPESLITSGFEMTYNPAQVNILSVQAYDGVDIAESPWDGESTIKVPDVFGPGSYMVALLQLNCASPDSGGDIILARVTFQCLETGISYITLTPLPNYATTVGCVSTTIFDTQMGTNILTVSQEKSPCTKNPDCNDGDVCTNDTCNIGAGQCQYSPVACDDNDVCTTNTCDSIDGCTYTPISCDDGSICTTDSCNPARGCEHTDTCDDNDLCTSDHCDQGTGTCTNIPVSCNDNNPCTDDSCNPAAGCIFINNTNTCDDGLFCTAIDACQSGICSGIGDPCPPEGVCNEDTDACIFTDMDSDGIFDFQDNCSLKPNGPSKGSCTYGVRGKTCSLPGINTTECGTNGYCSMKQEDSFPPEGNNCGDTCECEGNFDNDQDQDGTDSFTFKADFGRNPFNRPCTAANQCNGDFSCDRDVDGSDAALFKSDFGRGQFKNPCPSCAVGPWCSYQ